MHYQGDLYCLDDEGVSTPDLLQEIVYCLLQKNEFLRARLNTVADRNLTVSGAIQS